MVKDGEDEQDSVTLTASMLDEVPLAVEASCNEGGLSYKWYEQGELIEDGYSATYTTKPISSGYTYVLCVVSDDYGNVRGIWFYINCEN